MKLIIQDLIKFRDDRDWKQFHNEETLTMSLGIEAAELMECFQWNNEPELSRIKEEIADVFIYSLLALNEIKWDLKDLVKRKLDRSVEKYPKKKDVNLEDDSLMSIINKFRKERLWDLNDKGISFAKSIYIESGELLENYQWPEYYDFENVLDELADVFIYLYAMCNLYKLVPETIIREKMIINEKKYPPIKTA